MAPASGGPGVWQLCHGVRQGWDTLRHGVLQSVKASTSFTLARTSSSCHPTRPLPRLPATPHRSSPSPPDVDSALVHHRLADRGGRSMAKIGMVYLRLLPHVTYP